MNPIDQLDLVSTQEILECYSNAVENETGAPCKSLAPFSFEDCEIHFDSRNNTTVLTMYGFYVRFENMDTVKLINYNDDKGWFFVF
jgi:hypothetical protein